MPTRNSRVTSKSIPVTRTAEIVNVRRRQDRAAQTRQAILTAAKGEFASSGFGGATTRGIAARANVKHGLLVYHFDTKVGVWQAMMEQFLDAWHLRLLSQVEPLLHVDDVAALRAFLRAFIEMSAEDPDAHWLMSAVARESSEQISALIAERVGRDIDRLIALIERVQRQGSFIDGKPAHLYYLMIGAASRVFMLSTEFERSMRTSPFNREFVEQHIDACERLFFRGAA